MHHGGTLVDRDLATVLHPFALSSRTEQVKLIAGETDGEVTSRRLVSCHPDEEDGKRACHPDEEEKR
uniref:Uncharacterized protein n=1 Tax=Anguilla anguilla TaxID=7936 RepID=A0A0E9PFX1_ANGAN